MAAITVSIVSDRLPGLAAALPQRARQLVQRAVADVETQAKARCPVDTGALRASIQGRLTGDTSGEVAVGQEYGVYVEYGTATAPAQPFLRPAAEAVAPGFAAAVATLAGGR